MRLLPVLSVIAMAATTSTAQPRHEETSRHVSYVAPPPDPSPLSDGHWIDLASPTSVQHGTEYIMVGAEVGRFSQLRVDAYAGTVILRRIRIFGSDGSIQTMQFDRRLDRAHKSVVIDLFAGRALDQIAITTETRTPGMYTVHGSGATRMAAR